jgi:glycosyltransferase involved in cell wall biosynthesis
MRVAIVHYWLLNMRGGEQVVEALCRIFPQADLFTLFYDPERVSPLIRSKRVTASYLNPFKRYYRSLLPVMPMALENFDLRGYDLVISSESGPAKGIIVSASARHICYCHTPMRYLWDLYPDYLHEWSNGPVRKAALAIFSHYLRLWDYASAARVDQFIANSENVRRRIERAYRRDSIVIHPPVEVGSFGWRPSEDYYLAVSELVPYKRVDLAIAACTQMGRRLKVVGQGPEYRKLKRAAGPTIEFCGRVTAEELIDLYSGGRAFIQPGEEDFGIASVEALASGKPIIGCGRGGALEIAKGEPAGFFFEQPSIEDLKSAIERFEQAEPRIRPEICASLAKPYSAAAFETKIRSLVDEQFKTDLSRMQKSMAAQQLI